MPPLFVGLEVVGIKEIRVRLVVLV